MDNLSWRHQHLLDDAFLLFNQKDAAHKEETEDDGLAEQKHALENDEHLTIKDGKQKPIKKQDEDIHMQDPVFIEETKIIPKILEQFPHPPPPPSE